MTCTGQSGHGSAPLENTPGEKVRHILDRFMDYRSKELAKISTGVAVGEVTNINLTMINGGVQINVVPAEIKVVFDIRLAVGVDQVAFENMVRVIERISDLLRFSSQFRISSSKDQAMVRRGGRWHHN